MRRGWRCCSRVAGQLRNTAGMRERSPGVWGADRRGRARPGNRQAAAGQQGVPRQPAGCEEGSGGAVHRGELPVGTPARYYTWLSGADGPESEGRWSGRQADGLGLTGTVETGDLEALSDAVAALRERRDELRDRHDSYEHDAGRPPPNSPGCGRPWPPPGPTGGPTPSASTPSTETSNTTCKPAMWAANRDAMHARFGQRHATHRRAAHATDAVADARTRIAAIDA